MRLTVAATPGERLGDRLLVLRRRMLCLLVLLLLLATLLLRLGCLELMMEKSEG
jgi:hypothetical protein